MQSKDAFVSNCVLYVLSNEERILYSKFLSSGSASGSGSYLIL
jgi:hypothetical protein